MQTLPVGVHVLSAESQAALARAAARGAAIEARHTKRPLAGSLPVMSSGPDTRASQGQKARRDNDRKPGR